MLIGFIYFACVVKICLSQFKRQCLKLGEVSSAGSENVNLSLKVPWVQHLSPFFFHLCKKRRCNLWRKVRHKNLLGFINWIAMEVIVNANLSEGAGNRTLTKVKYPGKLGANKSSWRAQSCTQPYKICEWAVARRQVIV